MYPTLIHTLPYYPTCLLYPQRQSQTLPATVPSSIPYPTLIHTLPYCTISASRKHFQRLVKLGEAREALLLVEAR